MSGSQPDVLTASPYSPSVLIALSIIARKHLLCKAKTKLLVFILSSKIKSPIEVILLFVLC